MPQIQDFFKILKIIIFLESNNYIKYNKKELHHI